MKLHGTGLPLRGIYHNAIAAGAPEWKAQSFFSRFTFFLVDVYQTSWTEVEEYAKEHKIKLMWEEGITLSKTASLHYLRDGTKYVGYYADELGTGFLVIKSDGLEMAAM